MMEKADIESEFEDEAFISFDLTLNSGGTKKIPDYSPKATNAGNGEWMLPAYLL